MDLSVLFNLSYGMYVVGAMDQNRPVGCVVNTVFQVTSENPLLAVSLNKNNYTTKVLQRNKRFAVSIIAEDTEPLVIGTFGYRTSEDTDKYADFGYSVFDGAPLVHGTFCGRLILDAEQFVDCGTHYIVLSRLVNTIPGVGTPMTYSYFHRVIKGRAPKNAPTYQAPVE